jgi:hypothetical protein
MKKLDKLRALIESGKFPKKFPEFGGANLIITKDKNRNYHEGDIVVFSEHAPALSWLVIQLNKIYDEEIDYINKYDFYPSIGKLINRTLTKQELLFEVMLNIVGELEKEWGKK